MGQSEGQAFSLLSDPEDSDSKYVGPVAVPRCGHTHEVTFPGGRHDKTDVNPSVPPITMAGATAAAATHRVFCDKLHAHKKVRIVIVNL